MTAILTTPGGIALPSSQDIAQLDDALDRELSKRRLRNYIRRMHRNREQKFRETPMHVLLMEVCQVVDWGVLDRVVTNMPPQHGKSTIVSVGMPAWWMGRHPQRPFIGGSYNGDMALDFSVKVRDQFRAPEWPFTDIKLSNATWQKSLWRTNEGGQYRASAPDLAGTGYPSEGMSIDDPFKNKADARSPLVQKAVWDWYGTVLHARAHGFIMLTQTRWSDGDTTGRVLAQAEKEALAEQWFVLKLKGLHDGPEVCADVTLPDRIAREMGVGEDTPALTMEELLGRLRSLAKAQTEPARITEER